MQFDFVKKLTLGFVCCFLFMFSILGFIVYTHTKSTILNQSFNQLKSIQEAKGREIEKFFKTVENQVVTLSKSTMTSEAMTAFHEAFSAVGVEEKQSSSADYYLQQYKEEAANYYSTTFLPKLRENFSDELVAETFVPNTLEGLILQKKYIYENTHPLGEKQNLTEAEGSEIYHQVHKKYHLLFKEFLDKFGYYDLFLIDNTSGRIIYSVFKKMDFATSLLDGPYADTNFARVFKQSKDAEDPNTFFIEDFEFYKASYYAPASFIGAPIFANGKNIGTLVFQMPIDKINAIMTGNALWEKDGLGKSGETYLISNDLTMRSDSRFLLEDPEHFFAILDEMKATDNIELMRDLKTTILTKKIDTLAAQEAVKGVDSREMILSYHNTYTLSAFRPLNIAGLHWAILSEMDYKEALEPLYSLFYSVSQIAFVILCILLGSIFSVMARSFFPLKSAAAEIETSSSDIKEASVNFSNISYTLGKKIVELADQSEIIVKNTQDLDGYLAQVLEVSDETSKNIDTVSSASEKMSSEANQKHAQLRTIESFAGELSEGFSGLIDNFEEVMKASADASKIVDSIGDISSKIRLLALNATIESVRSGTAGKSFAVVADEVKLLAANVSEFVNQAQEGVNRINSTVKKTEDKFSALSRQLDEVCQSIRTVVDFLDIQVGNSNTINTQMNESRDLITQLRDKISRFQIVSKEISDEVGEIKNTSRDMEGLGQDIQARAATANSVGNRLSDIVGSMTRILGKDKKKPKSFR